MKIILKIVIFFSWFIIGCSAGENLLKPSPSTFVTVIWCDQKYITVENSYGTQWKIRNHDHLTFFAGDKFPKSSIWYERY